MRDVLGRLGDGFYWGGCLGVIWAVGYTLYDALTRGRWNDYLVTHLIAGGGWIFSLAVRYILSGYRGVKPIRPQETEKPNDPPHHPRPCRVAGQWSGVG